MQPHDLTEAMFKSYPALGRKVALKYLELLRDLPVVLDAILLRELQGYDISFPAEREEMDRRFDYLALLPAEERHAITRGFASLSVSNELNTLDWVTSPRRFEEYLSAYLWQSHQMDAFRTISDEFVHTVARARPALHVPMRRLTIAVLPAELHKQSYPMFRKLLPHGTMFSHVERNDGADGMTTVLRQLGNRSAKVPAPYGHWYIDGGAPLACPDGAYSISWLGSEPIRTAVLNKIESVIGSGSGGPEMLRSTMADLTFLAQPGVAGDPLTNAFVGRVYGEGAGTQIFSTTFVQWSARELLKRAQPLTLVVRFGPRRRQRSMNEMFAATATEPDFEGSALDADFATYYTWINLQRLPGGDVASFIAWSQHDGRAIAIGPDFARGVQAPNPIPIGQLLGSVTQG